MTTTTRKGVFISYSHSDEKWLRLLQKHLEPYKQIAYWDDTVIKPGDEWLAEIDAALARARIAVLLVTKDFLSSKFIQTHEMEEIVRASKSDGLRIYWIPIGFCSYETTILKHYQATHDPRQPLQKLQEWEWDDRLVRICKQIDKVLQDESYLPQAIDRPSENGIETGSTRPTKASTRSDFARCNRTKYLNRFVTFFEEASKRPGLPQICFVHGEVGQSHKRLVKRIQREVIKPVADKEATSANQLAMLEKEADVPWPDPHDHISLQKEDLQINLSGQYADRPSLISATTFAALELLSLYRFVTVQHTIHLVKGGEKDWVRIVETLKWYLQGYWGELARHLESTKEKPRWPQFIIFIKVRYEKPGLLQKALGRFLPSSSAKSYRELVESDLAQLVEETVLSFPCLLLGELITPTYSEVIRWYSDNDIYETDEDRYEAATKMYKQYGRALSMEMIEKELDRCLTRKFVSATSAVN